MLVCSHQLTSDLKRCLLFRKCLRWSSLKAVSVPTSVIGGLRGSTATSDLVQPEWIGSKAAGTEPQSESLTWHRIAREYRSQRQCHLPFCFFFQKKKNIDQVQLRRGQIQSRLSTLHACFQKNQPYKSYWLNPLFSLNRRCSVCDIICSHLYSCSLRCLCIAGLPLWQQGAHGCVDGEMVGDVPEIDSHFLRREEVYAENPSKQVRLTRVARGSFSRVTRK